MSFAAHLAQHRRSLRLSQLSLATRAGLSQKHVSFLETGRSAPMRKTVLRLAHALDLSIAARNDLLVEAGFTPQLGEAINAEELRTVQALTSDILAKQSPIPGILVNRAQDVLEVNAGFSALLRFAGKGTDLWQATCPDGRKNMLRLTLSREGLFPLMTQPELLIPAYLYRVRRSAGDRKNALGLIEEVSAWKHLQPYLSGSSDFREPAVTAERYTLYDREITLICLVASLGAPRSVIAEEMRIELFYPGDKKTEELIKALPT